MTQFFDEKSYWIGFSLIPGINRVKLGLLETYFGGLKQAWQATSHELNQSGLDTKCIQSIITKRPDIDIGTEIIKLDKLGIRVLNYHDASYPQRLKQIYDFPPLLYIKGSLLSQDEAGVAVVGSRLPTSYGKQVTEELTEELVRNGVTIISGMAKGIDTIAHQAAINAGGRTIAVCATGLDITYPASNCRLASNVIKHGAIISEYPPGTRPRPEYFPRRNRIMSGMSLGVLVTEAKERSGALITAKLALEHNREVFAVPGSIFSPNSIGSNWLIQQGAKLVTQVVDVMEELNLPVINQQKRFKEVLPENEHEALIIKALTVEPMHIDAIVSSSGIPITKVSSTLAMMEIKGQVRQTEAMTYTLAN